MLAILLLVEVGDHGHVERARAGDVIGGVGQLGGFFQVAVAPAPDFKHAFRVRLAYQRDVGLVVAGEVGNAGRIEPAVGRAQRRRLGDDLVAALALADYGKRRAALEIGFHHDDLVVAVAVEVGDARLEILEYGVVLEPQGLQFSVARFDHQRTRLDLVAENAVVVAVGRLGEPRARDVVLAGGNLPVGQRALRQFCRRRRVDEIERDFAVRVLDCVPQAAGHHAHLPIDRVDGGDARRYVDAIHAPALGPGRGASSESGESDQADEGDAHAGHF